MKRKNYIYIVRLIMILMISAVIIMYSVGVFSLSQFLGLGMILMLAGMADVISEL